MRPVPRFLSAADFDQFHRDGFLVVREAFARSDAAAMEHRWWV